MTFTLAPSIRLADIETSTAPLNYEQPAAALTTILQQLQAVVACLQDEQYTMRPVGVVDSSVGGHVRHCLDHVRALVTGIETGLLDYDTRERGTSIETNRLDAVEAIHALCLCLGELPDEILDCALKLPVMMTSDGPAIRVGTTVGRELAYVLSHTIHHNALIGTMVKLLGGWLPERFGYAPSTLAHLRGGPCAR